ncbi:MAG: sulfatase-like hydrolase/transferase [Acidimicrobiales bacterium]
MARRNILFVTTDQQRFDSLGCNGGTIARTPVADRLAAEGINFSRAYNQSTVCMPARCTMLTGQYPRTHGVVANGVALPTDAPSVAAYLSEQAGYRTALVGKAHFEPAFDFKGRWEENARWRRGDTGPWRGFDYSIQAAHVAAFQGRAIQHYGLWLKDAHPEHLESFCSLLNAEPGGDTGAPETKHNPIPREWYHTDWTADRTIDWLDTVPADDNFFCWMSFPDPHHPWDPPESEMARVNWRDLDLPAGHPGSPDAIRAVLDQKPAHWSAWYDGSFSNAEGGPMNFYPASLTDDQIREINARTHVMVELLDEALGRVIAHLEAIGRLHDTDIVFTTDHGELQGDFGFMFKGPWHVDSLMRLPLIWKPAASAGIAAGTVTDPVGQVDFAPTFCAIAGIEPASWMQGSALPTADGSGDHERALCEWDSQFPGYGMHLRSIHRDGWTCTVYEESTDGQPNGLEEAWGPGVLTLCGIHYDGTEGELYNVVDDPHQFHNLWDDPAHRAVRDDLVADLRASFPTERRVLPVEAPA